MTNNTATWETLAECYVCLKVLVALIVKIWGKGVSWVECAGYPYNFVQATEEPVKI